MNILFNASPAARFVTGIGTYAKELISHLLEIDRNNHYTVFSIKSPLPGRRLSLARSESKNVSYKSLTFPYRFLDIIWNNLKLLPVEKFFGKQDILHSLDKIAPFADKAKIITTIHDMAWYRFGPNNREGSLIYNQVVGTLKRSSAVITVSEFSKNDILKYLPFTQKKLHVIKEGVSARFRPIDRNLIPGYIQKTYPWNDYLLYFGPLDNPRKNVELIIKAYVLLKKKKKIEEKLLLCGRISKYSRGLLSLLKKVNMPDDIIIYSRWIPDSDIPYIYNKARLAILPSLYEGFGLPVLEAMACARPIIVSDIPSFREVAGDASIFVNPNEPEDLACAIERLLSDRELYDEMARRGLERAKEFTWIKTAQETLKLYERYAEK